ncbi:MAG: phosphatase PAP2 family protein [Steroidobacteraceae bacterium]
MNRFTHLWLPWSVYLPVFLALTLGHWDFRIAEHLFYDARLQHWLGTGTGEWWARDLIHTGGAWMVKLIAAATLIVWLSGYRIARLRDCRRDAAFAFFGIAAAVALIGVIKATSNMDCPWDLQLFGGERPFVGLFETRPGSLPRAKCFPGAHSGSAFALFVFYFIARQNRSKYSRQILVAALLLGAIFAFGQQARGAHFMSHDLTSAMLVWTLLYGLTSLRYRMPRHRRPQHALVNEES